MFRQIRMATNQTRMPVLSALPTAYFVTGDTGLKQTTEAAWANKYINVEEIAAIVPIPEAVLADAIGFDVWGNVMPLLQNAIARALDAAIFFGVNKPASWPNAIATDAATAGNTVNRGTATAAQGGLAGDLSAAFATVERDGFDVNGFVANSTYKGLLRDVRDTQGRQLLDTNGNVYGRGAVPDAGSVAGGHTTGAAERRGRPRRLHAGRPRRPSGHHLQDPRPGDHPGQHGGHPVQPRPAGHGRSPRRVPLRLPAREHHQLRQRQREHPLPVRDRQLHRQPVI
jgi:hypothetical protein